MNRILSFVISCVLILSLTPVSLSAADNGTLGDNITWSFSDDGALQITGNGDMPAFSSYKDQPWRDVAKSVKKITVSQGITSVGAYSFASLPAVTTVSLPKSITEIGAYAFEKCYSLKFFDMPSSVRRIGDGAFVDCWQLAEIDLALYASYLNFIGDEAFAGCSALATITLPMRLTHIGEGAFMGCASIDGIDLPDKLSYLGRFAFQSCTSLTSVNVPWQITHLPDYSFFGCSSLSSVTFGRYLESIGKEAFLWCPSLKEIHLPISVTEVPEHSIGYYYFEREFVKYDGVTVIAGSPAGMEYAVSNGFSLIIDDSSHVCDHACPYCDLCTAECEYFLCCKKCMGHTFPITGSISDSVKWSLSDDFVLSITGNGEIPDFAYNSVPWLPYRNCILKAVVGDGITSVGSFTFDSHPSLREVSLPDGLLSIGRKAFSLCTALSGVTLPDTVTRIDSLAFNGCASLEYVFFGEAVESIGDFAFFGCVRLLEAVLPENVRTIGDSAFENCPMLESFYVPQSVEYIGAFALGYLYSGDRHYIKNDNFALKAPLFSVGDSYAKENGFAFERSDTHLCESACVICGKCLDSSCPYPECARRCDGICTMEWDYPFTDVREGDWFCDSVRYVYLKGLFTGMTENTFAPSGGVTRAQLAVVLWRLAGAPEGGESPFEDLSAAWYRDAVSWAYGAGVVTGKSAKEFDPMGMITREQMVTMLMRFCEKVWKRDTEGAGDLEVFADTDKISTYALRAVSWAVAEGLMTGKESAGELYIAPAFGATRAECATIFARLLKK